MNRWRTLYGGNSVEDVAWNGEVIPKEREFLVNGFIAMPRRSAGDFELYIPGQPLLVFRNTRKPR